MSRSVEIKNGAFSALLPGDIFSNNMQEIIASSKQIHADTKAADGYIKEISKIVETNQKISTENKTAFEKIETASSSLKNSVI